MGFFATMAALDQVDTLELGRQAIIGFDWENPLPTIVTPGSVLSREQEIDGRYQTLSVEVQGSKARDAYKTAYAKLKANWDQFYASNQSWSERFFSGRELEDQLDRWDQQYRTAYDGFRRELAAVGAGEPATPPPPGPDPNSLEGQAQSAKTNAGKPTSAWVIGVVAIAGVFSVGYLIRAIKA